MPAPEDEKFGTRTVIMRPGVPGSAAAADDDRAHYLVVVEGEGIGTRIELGPGKLVIGRQEPADVVLPDTQISRRHCRVGLVMGELFVTDFESSNGTYVAGSRITGSKLVAAGERIAIGGTVLEHEWRSRKDVTAARELSTDLDKAKQYVQSLLPRPIASGPVRTEWILQPSAKLGGDLFGYQMLDDHTFQLYLLDVTGHGINAAMHAVSVMNVLRQHTMPAGVSPHDPASMASHLNAMFQMESHGGMLSSLWYGVFDLRERKATFTSAGHHAAYLVPPGRGAPIPLEVSNVLIGMIEGYGYKAGTARFEPGSSLYLFSDGVFEVESLGAEPWGLERFVSLLGLAPEPGRTEPQRIFQAVKARTQRDAFEDDFTLVVATLE
jgi:serine phosphatase RsbU (regulator of sigma subunit)